MNGGTPDNINITLNQASGKSKIELKYDYEVYIDRAKTWRRS